ncbi:hypothetical protein GFK17_22240, partial [Salmonella enterica subsp. enterica serovar Enteritidis]|nr:hypothetical protein [Salmonella enterica subsp. enterica serovar Enteritidis]
WKSVAPISGLTSYNEKARFSLAQRPTLGAVGGENIPTVAAEVVDESAKTLIGAAARSRL